MCRGQLKIAFEIVPNGLFFSVFSLPTRGYYGESNALRKVDFWVLFCAQPIGFAKKKTENYIAIWLSKSTSAVLGRFDRDGTRQSQRRATRAVLLD